MSTGLVVLKQRYVAKYKSRLLEDVIPFRLFTEDGGKLSLNDGGSSPLHFLHTAGDHYWCPTLKLANPLSYAPLRVPDIISIHTQEFLERGFVFVLERGIVWLRGYNGEIAVSL